MELFVEQSIQFIDFTGCPKFSMANCLTALLGSINPLCTPGPPQLKYFLGEKRKENFDWNGEAEKLKL